MFGERDIIDVHKVLDIEEYMVLDMNVKNNEGGDVSFINPSSCKKYICFRTLLCKDNWLSNVCIYNKEDTTFTIIPEHTDCPNIEDLRIFDYQGRVWFIGYLRRRDNGIFETYIGQFNQSCDCIERVVGCISKNGVHIKNITPLIQGTNLWFIDIKTGYVYRYTDQNGITKSHELDMTKLTQKMAAYTNSVLGSTQYVCLKDSTYGALVHITKRIGSKLHYIYLWIEIDTDTWSITFVSDKYVVYEFGLVFVSHIEKITEDTFQLMFGRKDKYTCRCVAKLQNLRYEA